MSLQYGCVRKTVQSAKLVLVSIDLGLWWWWWWAVSAGQFAGQFAVAAALGGQWSGELVELMTTLGTLLASSLTTTEMPFQKAALYCSTVHPCRQHAWV